MEGFMRGSTRPLLLALAVMMTVVVSTSAADTGTVSGFVFDQNGQPVAEATAKISGDALPVTRTAQTGANGTYQFDYLVPGEYTIEIDKAGVGRARRAAVVELGKDTQVDFVVGLPLREELTVTAATPVVDVRSTEVSFNFKSETITGFPLDRN